MLRERGVWCGTSPTREGEEDCQEKMQRLGKGRGCPFWPSVSPSLFTGRVKESPVSAGPSPKGRGKRNWELCPPS